MHKTSNLAVDGLQRQKTTPISQEQGFEAIMGTGSLKQDSLKMRKKSPVFFPVFNYPVLSIPMIASDS